MNIAIFGTSADPPTSAHKIILHYLSSHYNLVAVYASDNPFKSHGTDLCHRNRMLELLIEDLNLTHGNVLYCPEISDVRTIHTVTKARKKWGENIELTIVIGTDLAEQIFTWYEAQKLWKGVKILLIPRDGYTIDFNVVQNIDKITLGCAIAQCQIPPFSSTDYRNNHNQEVLTDKVKDYIQENSLYFN
ncbi:MAG: nicotinate-nucleotide adenylyltransferase [Cyanobacteria bacterium]|nr:nicotinate-nucleotide adenylyltransferase [Cyanobacteria bacterium CG_2015-16_32_12]NCO78578.1 nicotinate-nucleotide adenylyltransferase [Cyanobacteria bacterium CG_2015-22_32_23]NCQ03809.1 nicotinate-nucleotide adenylyltransferase [Cyanobacteria bacterium CG_2015-09_32_10]NCQ42873.1 nicotinate-nucleotide adenylyltransferase [Cyanobacteria bacterium CG_2015-04_32_10]NCS85023.1 nicotinate-nucleotide adenylyltransferase [Cyanobacteria bacterium CG_2015-02_32_10]